jgi:hypothetical protein
MIEDEAETVGKSPQEACEHSPLMLLRRGVIFRSGLAQIY